MVLLAILALAVAGCGDGDDDGGAGSTGTTQAASACADQKLASTEDVTLILDFLPNPIHIAIYQGWPPEPPGRLEEPTAGTLWLNGDRVDAGRLLGRVGYMPQRDLLMPWRTILDNTILGLEVAGVGRAEARRRAGELFDDFGLAGFERRRPSELSGGMRQRAALLRTFLAGREVILLDEPFGALDSLTRAGMQQWLVQVWEEHRKTILLITHDVDEALFLSDRVYVLTPGPAGSSWSWRSTCPGPGPTSWSPASPSPSASSCCWSTWA